MLRILIHSGVIIVEHGYSEILVHSVHHIEIKKFSSGKSNYFTMSGYYTTPEITITMFDIFVSTSEQVKPEEETLVRTVTIKNVTKTCFSTKPVRKCPPGSEPEKKEHRLVSFYCIRSSLSKTKTYLDIVKRRVLDEVRDKRADRNEYVDMPTDCIKP